LTPLIVIEKVREIYQYQWTAVSSNYPYIQVHLDTVKNLVKFVELEMETSEKTQEKDKEILYNFANELGIEEKQLVELSYSDLLLLH
jgi:adenylate cyclase class IV